MPKPRPAKEAATLRADVKQLAAQLSRTKGKGLTLEALEQWRQKLSKLAEGTSDREEVAEQLIALGVNVERQTPKGAATLLSQLALLVVDLVGGEKRAAELFERARVKKKVELNAERAEPASHHKAPKLWK